MSPLRSSAGPGDLADADAELAADDLRERGLAEPGRPREQDVVERLAARLRRVERDRELLLDALLADEVGERLRAAASGRAPPRAVVQRRREELLAHAACLSAARTCSSTGSSSSTSASARSASTSDQPSSTSASRASSEPPSPAARDSRRRRRSSPSARARRAARSCGRCRGSPRSARVLAHDRAAQLLGRRAGDDRERDLRPDARDAEQQLEQLALVGGREAVELERVLAHVQVRLDRRLLADARVAPAASRRRGSRRRRRRRRCPRRCARPRFRAGARSRTTPIHALTVRPAGGCLLPRLRL